MPVLNVNLNPLAIPGHAFIPRQRKPTSHGADLWERRNPGERLGKAQAALFVIGLTSADELQKFELKDVVDIVREVRTDQAGDPSASFLTQRGIYKHQDGTGRVVEEDGVRVVIINTSGASEEDFESDMVQLAEAIAEDLEQETVILEMQKGGVTQETWEVRP